MPKQLQKLVSQMLLFYGTQLPDHKGKGRLVDWIIGKFHLQDYPGVPIEIQRDGLAFSLELGHYFDRCLYYFGEFDPWDTEVLRRMIQPGWVVFDIGSHVGWYALHAAHEMGGNGTVHAFEPAPEDYKRLARNVELNGFRNVELHQEAVSEAPGVVWLTDTWDAGTSRLATKPEESKRSIRSTSLDVFVEESGLQRLDFAKVDIEGAEMLFLKGAGKALERFRPFIMIEVSEDTLHTFGATGGELLNRLREMRYQLFVVRPQGLIALASGPSAGRFLNCVAIPQEYGVGAALGWNEISQLAGRRQQPQKA